MVCSRQDTITLANNLIFQFNRLSKISLEHSVGGLCLFIRRRGKAIIELEDSLMLLMPKKWHLRIKGLSEAAMLNTTQWKYHSAQKICLIH